MALNAWWENDPEQRYWMEIFTGPDPGNQLLAPQFDDGHWSYALPSLVKPGDVVFHYSSSGRTAKTIVGWSVVLGPPEIIKPYTWSPRGTSGRARGTTHRGKGWRVPLGGVNDLSAQVDGPRLHAAMPALMQLRDSLNAKHDGPLYFPWYQYGPNEMRAQQGYLTKFPAEILDILPELRVAAPGPLTSDDEIPEDSQKPKKRAPKGRVTRIQDPVLRAAIERRSLDVALAYYASIGGTDAKELGKPYDIKVTVAGVERHCEVKGSCLLIDTVELTVNEVTHGRDYPDVDLVVVDGIEWSRNPDNSVSTRGGRLRVWSDWEPLNEDLNPRKYAYLLPPNIP